jgi:hypothetical protein
MATLALIVPRRTIEKHLYNPIASAQRFLNFGALALGTYLNSKRHDVEIIDEYALKEDANIPSELIERFGSEGPQVIGISCISAYSADRALYLGSMFRDAFPKAIVVAGGQHFAGLWAIGFKERLPETSVLIAGEAEIALADVLQLVDNGIAMAKWKSIDLPGNVWFTQAGKVAQGARQIAVVNVNEVVCATYSLYPFARNLFPSLEFSRGCPYACIFCANTMANRKNFRRVETKNLRRGLDLMLEHFQRPCAGFYMQASNFFVTEDEAKELSNAFSGTSSQFAWRTEVRVDELSPKSLKFLYRAGLRFLDLGLESASESILLVMNKTRNPPEYLRRAAQLLDTAVELGIFTKVNYLIHAGDTHATVRESLRWLKVHREAICGISSGVMLEYEGTPLSNRLASFSNKYGTRRRPHELSKWGVFHLDPSDDLPLEEAERIAISIGQEMQTREAFVRSKTFGYLPFDTELQSAVAELPEADHTTPYS